jgi:hypothetical protein
MSRSLFMLLTGAYGLLLTVVMLFTPEAAIRNYGAPELNLNHIAVMQFLGLSTGATALMTLLNRNAPNSYTLRTLLCIPRYGGSRTHEFLFYGRQPVSAAVGAGVYVFLHPRVQTGAGRSYGRVTNTIHTIFIINQLQPTLRTQ